MTDLIASSIMMCGLRQRLSWIYWSVSVYTFNKECWVIRDIIHTLYIPSHAEGARAPALLPIVPFLMPPQHPTQFMTDGHSTSPPLPLTHTVLELPSINVQLNQTCYAFIWPVKQIAVRFELFELQFSKDCWHKRQCERRGTPAFRHNEMRSENKKPVYVCQRFLAPKEQKRHLSTCPTLQL